MMVRLARANVASRFSVRIRRLNRKCPSADLKVDNVERSLLQLSSGKFSIEMMARSTLPQMQMLHKNNEHNGKWHTVNRFININNLYV